MKNFQKMFPSSYYWFFCLGCRACFVFLEQRVHHVAHRGEQSGYHAHNVPCALSHLQGALEPNHCSPRLQRTQNLHGNELKAVWWPHCFLQGWKAKVSYLGSFMSDHLFKIVALGLLHLREFPQCGMSILKKDGLFQIGVKLFKDDLGLSWFG